MQTTDPVRNAIDEQSARDIQEQAEAERARILAEAAAAPFDPGSAPLLNPASHPDAARDLILATYQLAAIDVDVAMVLNRAMAVVLSELIWERAADDDAFAQRVAGIILQSQALPTTPPPPPKTPRGKQGTKRRTGAA